MPGKFDKDPMEYEYKKNNKHTSNMLSNIELDGVTNIHLKCKGIIELDGECEENRV